MHFKPPKVLADSCLIPKLSCQLKPVPWQGFNSFHRARYPLLTCQLDHPSRKPPCRRHRLAIQEPEESGNPTQRPASFWQHHMPKRGKLCGCSAVGRHPGEPPRSPWLTGPPVTTAGTSSCIQGLPPCSAAWGMFCPAATPKIIPLQ